MMYSSSYYSYFLVHQDRFIVQYRYLFISTLFYVDFVH